MPNLKQSLALFLLLPILLLSSGCSVWPKLKEISVQTVEVKRTIPLQNNPRPVDMNEMYFWVVTEQNFDEFKEILETKGGFISAHWDGTSETENKIKELTKATIRCIPLDNPKEDGKCVFSGAASTQRVLFAKAY